MLHRMGQSDLQGGGEMINEELHALGITIKHLIAGFAGGVVSALLMRNVRPFEALSSVLGGTLAANYFTEHAVRTLGFGEGAAGFLIGLTAMILCQKIIEAARKWVPGIGSNSGGNNAS